MPPLHIVTGAYGYSGKYVAQRLLNEGHRVRTLTNSLNRPNPFSDKVEAHPFNFENRAALVESMHGAEVFYNTYWVRFNYTMQGFQHSVAVENTLRMFEAAKEAGVKRIVHISITNPSKESPLEYFSGKAVLEEALINSGVSYCILRPTVLFGKEDILINNIAWTLRHLPLFGVFGDGKYRLQPIYVDDLAQLMVEQGKSRENKIIDAIGPETFTYRELAETVGEIIGAKKPVVSVPIWFGYASGWVIGKMVNDVLITREEIEGLMADLLYTKSAPAGSTKLTEWTREHKNILGMKYASELARRRDRNEAYEKL
ncbi:MAG: NAD(P)H-binding protein [Chloroflexi bacterium]|nr:NAD(P)H-binding protein [Chloroflexota bacterium]